MLVRAYDREYTLYVGSNGEWTMHEWDVRHPSGCRWQETFRDVSARDPFLRVEYDAWR
jgi:hypothetical protein